VQHKGRCTLVCQVIHPCGSWPVRPTSVFCFLCVRSSGCLPLSGPPDGPCPLLPRHRTVSSSAPQAASRSDSDLHRGLSSFLLSPPSFCLLSQSRDQGR
jgi:hypothetical protein